MYLLSCPSSELQDINIGKSWPCKPGGLLHTVRFDPVSSNTNGLFVAKFVKPRSDSLVNAELLPT